MVKKSILQPVTIMASRHFQGQKLQAGTHTLFYKFASTPTTSSSSFHFLLLSLQPFPAGDRNLWDQQSCTPKTLHGKNKTRQFYAPPAKWNSRHLWTLKCFLLYDILPLTKEEILMFKEKLSERYSWYAQLGRKWRFLEAVKPHTRKNK